MDRAIGDARAAIARKDFHSAIAVLRPLVEGGSREAQFELATIALTECDLLSGREAFALFLNAAEQGHIEAMYHVARFPEFVSEPFGSPLSDEEVWQWLVRAARSGSIQAQYDVAALLATGDWDSRGVPQDLEATVAWYRRAAEAGHALAQFNLASMLSMGEGCERDIPAAREWLRRAKAGGYEDAEILLAQLDSI
jgi:uncharacterized protein